jgi:ElaB/YqjD/DUF883 family membrane-anchored ribosome-binding protein
MSNDTITEQEQAMSTYISQSPSEPSTTEQAREKAQEAAGQAKEKAGSRLRSQVDRRSTEAGHRVGGYASDVRSVGEQLREQGKDQPAQLAEQAADRAERLGRYLTQSDADRILGDVEDFGRRRPWAVIAGGLALGLVASRLLKASSSDRYQQRTSGQPPERPPYRPTEVPEPGATVPVVRDSIVPTTPAPTAFDAGR